MENKKKKKIKKILFISTRNPFSGRYSGDVIRSLKIINSLKKKYNLKVISLSEKKLEKVKENLITFDYPNLFNKFLNCIISIFKFQPIHFGLFFSKKMKSFIQKNANEYDYLFFYHVRSSQYLPDNYYNKSIIEMIDLYSSNYLQTFNSLSFLNPFKYIYLLESWLMKSVENKIFDHFDKTILLSKSEINQIDKKFKNKIIKIDESADQINKSYLYSKKNFKILFVGNLNYLPNLLACKEFVNNILPKLRAKSPQIKFSIIGNISKFDKLLLSIRSGVEILGPKKNISKCVKNSFCGLANLRIATGVQGKVLTYMSHGLPVICSEKVAKNFGSSVISYKNEKELIQKILDLQKNKQISNKFSKKAIKFSKKLTYKKMSLSYIRSLNF